MEPPGESYVKPGHENTRAALGIRSECCRFSNVSGRIVATNDKRAIHSTVDRSATYPNGDYLQWNLHQWQTQS